MKINRCFGCMAEIQGYPCPQCGYDARSADTASYVLQPGTILNGKYLVGKVLGQGGFGITYIGLDLALERKVAIKEYFPSGQVSRHPSGGSTVLWYTTATAHTAKSSGMEMFIKEARKMTKVSNNPNVVHVLDLFQENETAYIIMDFIEGQTLKDLLKQTGPMHWQDAKKLFLPVIRAMEQVHQAGLIHRDLSPDNLMIQPDGTAKILDLGAAKDLNINSGASSMVVAKGGFSPMEQYVERGGSGPWTDVYSMAATLYYTLTGVVPPSAIERLEVDGLNWNAPGLRELPPTAIAGLKRALAVKSRDRTQSMAAFLEELLAAPAPSVVSASPVIPKQQTVPVDKTAPKKEFDIPAVKPWQVAATCLFIAVLICFSISQSEHGFSSPLMDSAGENQMASYAQNQNKLEVLMRTHTPQQYFYANGGRLEMYFDGEDQEFCRVYINPEGEMERMFTAVYDDAGNMVEECGYQGDKLMWRIVTTYTSDGNRSCQETWDGEGNLITTEERSYNAQGNNTGGICRSGDGTVQYRWTTEVDAAGTETRSFVYANGKSHVAKWDADGNLLESIGKKADGTFDFHMESSYDREGKETQYCSYREDGSLGYKEEYVYTDGQLTRKITHSYSDDGDYRTEFEMVYGPGNVMIGERTDSSITEELSMIGGTTIQSFFVSEYLNGVNYYGWNGDMLCSLYYNEDDVMTSISEYHYDDTGLFEGYTYQYYSAYADTITIIEYNADYEQISEREVPANGQMLEKPQYLSAYS